MIELTNQPIETDQLLAAVQNRNAGAVVLFVGVTREFTGDRQTQCLDYECYPEMAQAKLAELVEQADQRWDVCDIAVVHRLGRVELEEASVAIAVSAPHRKAAFEAGQWLIDTLKEVVPIWKCENWTDGTTEWVHPGLNGPGPGPGPAFSPPDPSRANPARADASSPADASSAREELN
jgi:molybdopterin synthase catalytic subunit